MEQNFCDSIVGNTGLPKCPPVYGKPKGVFFASEDVQITPNDMADLFDFFDSRTQLNDSSLKVFPVIGMKQLDDGYTEPTSGTLAGYGWNEDLGDGTMVSTFQFPVNVCIAKALESMRGYKGRAFILCDNGIIGVTRLDNGNYIGLPVENLGVRFAGGVFKDGANVKTVQLVITFGSDVDFVRGMDAIKYDFNPENIMGLQNVREEKVANLNYKVVTTCGSTNLFDKYQTLLENPEVWNVSKTADGTPVTLTTVVAQTNTKSFVLTPSAALTIPYKISISLADTEKLKELGIIGFEQVNPFIDNVIS